MTAHHSWFENNSEVQKDNQHWAQPYSSLSCHPGIPATTISWALTLQEALGLQRWIKIKSPRQRHEFSNLPLFLAHGKMIYSSLPCRWVTLGLSPLLGKRTEVMHVCLSTA